MNQVTDDLTPLLASAGFFDDVPFDNISVSVFFDAEDGEPVVGKVVKAYDELQVAVVMDGKKLRWAEDGTLRQQSDEYVYNAIAEMCFQCLAQVTEEYDIAFSGRLEDLRRNASVT